MMVSSAPAQLASLIFPVHPPARHGFPARIGVGQDPQRRDQSRGDRFAGNVELMWKLAAVMAACNLTGSILGSRMALKHGTGFVRRMFLAVVTVLILRLAYDTFLR